MSASLTNDPMRVDLAPPSILAKLQSTPVPPTESAGASQKFGAFFQKKEDLLTVVELDTQEADTAKAEAEDGRLQALAIAENSSLSASLSEDEAIFDGLSEYPRPLSQGPDNAGIQIGGDLFLGHVIGSARLERSANAGEGFARAPGDRVSYGPGGLDRNAESHPADRFDEQQQNILSAAAAQNLGRGEIDQFGLSSAKGPRMLPNRGEFSNNMANSDALVVVGRGAAAAGVSTPLGLAPQAAHIVEQSVLGRKTELTATVGSKYAMIREPGEAPKESARVQTRADPLDFGPPLARLSSIPSLFFHQQLPGTDAIGPFSNIGVRIDHAYDERLAVPDFHLAAFPGAQITVLNDPLGKHLDLPQALGQQIVAAAHQSGDGKSSVELLFSPEELGQVRLKLTSHEGIVTVSLLAERTETLDLLRRHIDTLARALLEAGYEGAQFSFGDQDASDDANQELYPRRDAVQEERSFAVSSDLAEISSTAPPVLYAERINVLI